MRQRWIFLAVIGFATGLCRPAFSNEPPKDYFNRGSAHFIKGQRDEALAEVKAGLNLYPDDYYLQALKKAIEEDKQQQQNQDQQKKDQEKKDQEKKDQEQKQKDQDKKKQDQEKQDKQEKDQQQDQKDEQEKKQDQEQQAQPVKAEDMTKEEAMQLLDALKQQEQADREKIRVSVGAPVPVEKDW